MIKLQVGKVYKGKINQQLVLFMGIEIEAWMGSQHNYPEYYVFQYIDPKIVGQIYNQTIESVLAEDYQLQEVATTLYGKV